MSAGPIRRSASMPVAVLRRLRWASSSTRPMSDIARSPIGGGASTLAPFRQRPRALPCTLPCMLPYTLPCDVCRYACREGMLPCASPSY